MATEYTSSMGSGYATNVMFYPEGPFWIMKGHYSAPGAATALFETGFYHIDNYYVQDSDPATFVFTSKSNGEIGVYCSGLVAGATGWFEFKGW